VIKAILIDIEGTVGDIAFVREVLFPYARKHMSKTLEQRWGDQEIAAIVADAARAAGSALPSPSMAAAQFLAWMDQDQKVTPLKTLQGMIWREGYASGELKAHLYPDAIEAFDVWRKKGLSLFIYSSGSIEAQKLYFAHSIAGDLTSAISGYFDTTTGPKADPESYAKISAAIKAEPASILFLTDAPGEVAAATKAGLQVRRIDRTQAPAFVGKDAGTAVLGSFAKLIPAPG
jgi:enolase-phosphatase E1